MSTERDADSPDLHVRLCRSVYVEHYYHGSSVKLLWHKRSRITTLALSGIAGITDARMPGSGCCSVEGADGQSYILASLSCWPFGDIKLWDDAATNHRALGIVGYSFCYALDKECVNYRSIAALVVNDCVSVIKWSSFSSVAQVFKLWRLRCFMQYYKSLYAIAGFQQYTLLSTRFLDSQMVWFFGFVLMIVF